MDNVLQEARKQDEQAIRDLLADANGRRFVLIVLATAHWNESVFAVEPTALAFNVGQQSVANEVYRKLDLLQPELLARAFKEERDRQDAMARRIERERSGE